MSTTPNKSRLGLIVDLVKIVTWPIMVLLLIVIFWTPLHEIAAALPSIVERSESFEIGALSVKVRHGRLDAPPPDVEAVLAKLDPANLPALLNFRHPNCYSPSDFQWARNTFAEMLELRLLEVTDDFALCTQHPGGAEYTAVIRPTLLGTRTQNFLFDLLRQMSS
jgi:hypothetical protein